MSIRENAISLAERGFRVFPCVPGQKRPALFDWPNRATSDVDQVKLWWPEDDDTYANNIGVAMGRGVVAIDLDVKHKAKGYESFKTMQEVMGGLPPFTFTVNTPSGGQHLYFKTNFNGSGEDLGNAVNVFKYDGVDVRGKHGYVVGPGSKIDGKEYEILFDEDLAELPKRYQNDLPKWREEKKRELPTTFQPEELDSSEAVARAVSYLRTAAPAVEGGGGDSHTYSVACHVLDYGLTVDEAWGLMLQHWNHRCSPPWDSFELHAKVEHAERYRKDPVGIKAPSTEFTEAQPVIDRSEIPNNPPPLSESEFQPQPQQTKLPDLFENVSDIALGSIRPPELIKGWLAPSQLGILYGQSNTGKSFLAALMAYCIASGLPFGEAEVEERGIVLYIAAEGGKQFRKRLAALKMQHQATHPADDFLYLMTTETNFTDTDTGRTAVAKLIERIKLQFGDRVKDIKLVVIDTLSRVNAGANENSAEDMSGFIRQVDKFQRALHNCACIIVHHSGKNEAMGARGSSVTRAAADVELEVKLIGKASGTLTATKQRDIEPAPPLQYKLCPIVLPFPEGIAPEPNLEPDTTCVAKITVGASFEFAIETLDPHSQTALASLEELEIALKRAVHSKEIRKKIVEKVDKIDLSTKKARNTFYQRFNRTMTKLADAGLVMEIERNQWVSTKVDRVDKR